LSAAAPLESSSQVWLLDGYRAAHGLLWTTVGSVALGALLGLLMDSWDRACEELGRSDDHLVGTVLIAVGATQVIESERPAVNLIESDPECPIRHAER
jgi:hypothetical protein